MRRREVDESPITSNLATPRHSQPRERAISCASLDFRSSPWIVACESGTTDLTSATTRSRCRGDAPGRQRNHAHRRSRKTLQLRAPSHTIGGAQRGSPRGLRAPDRAGGQAIPRSTGAGCRAQRRAPRRSVGVSRAGWSPRARVRSWRSLSAKHWPSPPDPPGASMAKTERSIRVAESNRIHRRMMSPPTYRTRIA
ncbi:MAG: hypothetical protein QOJ75_1417 [Chloroflexota bacterium]|nr:hypothetical protein [Chloroflexota bacterium]